MGSQDQAEYRRHHPAAGGAENPFGRQVPDLDSPGEVVQRNGPQDDEVHQDVEHGDEQGAGHQRPGEPFGTSQVPDDVHRGVPAGVGVGNEHEGNRKTGTQQQPEVPRFRNEWRCDPAGPEPHGAERDDQQDLGGGEDVVHSAAPPGGQRMHGGEDDHGSRREVDRLDPRKQRLQVGGHRDRRKRGGRRETHGGRNAAGGESGGRVETPAEQVVLAPGTGKRGSQFAVDERSRKRNQPADDPEQERRECGRNRRDLKPEARENPGSDHVRHHEHGGGPQRETEGRDSALHYRWSLSELSVGMR